MSRHLPLAGVLIIAAILGFDRLDVPVMWFDEAVTLDLVQTDWSRWVALVRNGQDLGGAVHSLVMRLLGIDSLEGIRMASVVCWLAVCGVVVATASRIGIRHPWMASVPLVVLPVTETWARQARGYMLWLLLCAVLTHLLVIALGRLKTSRIEGGLVALSLVITATHGFGIFFVAGVGVVLMLHRWRWGLAVLLLPALCLGPWLWLSREYVVWVAGDFHGNGPLTGAGRDLMAMWIPEFSRKTYLIASLIVIAGIAVTREILVEETRGRRLWQIALILVPVIAGPLLVSWFTGPNTHHALPRYFLPAAVPVALLLGAALSRASWAGGGLCVAALIGTFYTPATTHLHEEAGHLELPTGEVIRHLDEVRGDGEWIGIYPPHWAFLWQAMKVERVMPVGSRALGLEALRAKDPRKRSHVVIYDRGPPPAWFQVLMELSVDHKVFGRHMVHEVLRPLDED